MTFHIVSDPDQVRDIMRRTDEFVPTNALTSVVPLCAAARRILSRVRFALPPVLASATGEQHRTVRRLVAGFFTPAKVAGIGPRIRELTRERLQTTAGALEDGPTDLADVLARHIPPAIMSELTGLACPELTLLKRWSRDSLELFWGWPDEDRQVHLAHSAAEFYVWLRNEVARGRGTDSLFGVLDSAGLSAAEICSLGYFLVIAGQETTSQLINTALFRGIADRQQWYQLGADGTATGTGTATKFVRQVLATESSVPTWRRAVARETTLAGMVLPAGAEVLLQLTGRHPADAAPTAYSLAFGHGLHRCLGAKLAELETVLVVEETARALPDLRLVDTDPGWLRLLSFQTPLSVTVSRRTP